MGELRGGLPGTTNMRAVDVMLAVPGVLLAITVVAALKRASPTS